MRVRGLKQRMRRFAYGQVVAPHAGAWIETRGQYKLGTFAKVAPHAGAWIETFTTDPLLPETEVAPHAGAWIETDKPRAGKVIPLSHPMRVRGLKHKVDTLSHLHIVAPHAGAWIETVLSEVLTTSEMSHPMRVRGLKLSVNA